MGQWERNVKEAKLLDFSKWIGTKVPPEEKLVEFQQRIWKKIPAEDEEWLSMSKRAVEKRRYRAKKKMEYEDYITKLRRMRDVRKNKKNF